jgi:aspartyl aminopeptidase
MRLPLVLALTLLTIPLAADEPLLGHKPTAWERKEFQPHREAAMALGKDYLAFLTEHKTEREVVAALLSQAKALGFEDLLSRPGPPRLAAGDRRYAQAHGKILALTVVGKRPLSEGLHIIAAHIDAVRIDLKQRPLYADANLALLETHYYGGIKNYQWLSHPLELRGVVIKKDGTRVDIALGRSPEDPVLVIPDVLVHLSHYVDDEEGEEVPAEHLDPVLSSTPSRTPSPDLFAAEAARLLFARYGISVEDLATAELELVPASPARSVGLDSALVGGYGQDDRACSFAAARALFGIARAKQVPEHTALVLFVDKEEIGSSGNTGAQSSFLRRVVGELLEAAALPATELALDRVLSKSTALSADVTSAAQPHYAKLHDRRNAAFLGSGVVWDDSGVHAELFAYLRGLLDRAGITHQTALFTTARGGKHEGGTVLPFLTQHGMEGINVSIPLLSMHSPFELVSKADLYEGFRAYREFLLAK